MDLAPSEIGIFVRTLMDDQFATVAVVTFFLCEGIFNVFPVERARMKQLTALLLGGVLGYFLIAGAPVDSFIQGLLAGGATTVLVAKFKKPGAGAAAMPPPTPAGALPPGPSWPPQLSPPLEPADHL